MKKPLVSFCAGLLIVVTLAAAVGQYGVVVNIPQNGNAAYYLDGTGNLSIPAGGGGSVGGTNLTANVLILAECNLGTIAGGGTATLNINTNLYRAVFSGSTFSVNLPTPTDATNGFWAQIVGTNTSGGTQVGTYKAATVTTAIWNEEQKAAVTTVTNASGAAFTLDFRVSNGAWSRVASPGDAITLGNNPDFGTNTVTAGAFAASGSTKGFWTFYTANPTNNVTISIVDNGFTTNTFVTFPGTPASGFLKGTVTGVTNLAISYDGTTYQASNTLAGAAVSTTAAIQNQLERYNSATTQWEPSTIAELQPVMVVSTANVASLSGTTTIDSQALVAGNRVLLTAQSTGSQNGPWTIAAGAWTRPSTYSAASSVSLSSFLAVALGSTYSNTFWQLSGQTTNVVVDTTSTTWTQLFPLTASSTATFTGKTYDSSATGNVLKFKSYLKFNFPRRIDGTGCTYPNTNDFTLNTFMVPRFSGTVATNSNWCRFAIRVPKDIDTSVDPVASLTVRLSAADTGAQIYNAGFASVANSAVATATVGTWVIMNVAADASGASDDVESVSNVTLTGWGAGLTAGQWWVVELNRAGAVDASTVASDLLELEIEYGVIQ